LLHSCQTGYSAALIANGGGGGGGGVLGNKEERDAFGFIPRLKEDSKSWLLTFVAVLFRNVDKFTYYLKINVTIKQKMLRIHPTFFRSLEPPL